MFFMISYIYCKVKNKIKGLENERKLKTVFWLQLLSSNYDTFLLCFSST